MRVYPLALIALALIAGTAGYVTHQAMGKSGGNSGSNKGGDIDVVTTAQPTASAQDAAAGAASAAGTETAAPEAALDWSFADLDGSPQVLGQYHDKVTVLNFWATWCPPCLREIPAFVDLQSRYGEAGLNFVGIALDHAEVVAPFVSDKAMNYPVVVGDQQVVKFMQTLGNAIGGLPYTAVIDSRGEVVYTHQGEWHAEAAEALLRELLERS